MRPGDVLCGWGHFLRDQLVREHAAVVGAWDAGHEWLDLRSQVARWLQDTPGDPEHAARLLGRPAAAPAGQGRAGRSVAVLAEIVAALRALRGSG